MITQDLGVTLKLYRSIPVSMMKEFIAIHSQKILKKYTQYDSQMDFR